MLLDLSFFIDFYRSTVHARFGVVGGMIDLRSGTVGVSHKYVCGRAQVAMPRFCLELALWAGRQNGRFDPSKSLKGHLEPSTGGFLT